MPRSHCSCPERLQCFFGAEFHARRDGFVVRGKEFKKLYRETMPPLRENEQQANVGFVGFLVAQLHELVELFRLEQVLYPR